MQEFDVNDFTTNEDDSDFLGSGSYASVRRCYHNELGTVVVKCFNITGSKTTINEHSHQMTVEADVLHQLQHKNIIKVFGVTKWSSRCGIVMEEAAGYNLEDLCIHNKNKNIPWGLRLQFFKEIADGLEYLQYHKKNRAYIHGDLKLQNILLDGDFVVKIADFGGVSFTRGLSAPTSSPVFQTSKQHTWPYSAPEILKDPSMDSTRAMDVYSYGIIGYEIICRHQAFFSSKHISPGLIYVLIKYEGQKPDLNLIEELAKNLVDESDSQICSGLKDIVVKCWSTDPTQRPDIKEVQSKLTAISQCTQCKSFETEHLKKPKVSSNCKNILLSQYDFLFDIKFKTQQSGSTSLKLASSLAKSKLNEDDPSSPIEEPLLNWDLCEVIPPKTNKGHSFHDPITLFKPGSTQSIKRLNRGVSTLIPSSEIFIQTGTKGFLGSGSIGTVHRAYVEDLNVVAIKCQSLKGSKEEILRNKEKFIKEIEMLNKASHPNIVKIEGYATWRQSVAIVMEYLPCCNLNDLILAKDGDAFKYEIPPNLQLKFCSHISSGIAYLHNSFHNIQVVHGHLEPVHILLTLNLSCKLGSFGIAEFAKNQKEMSGLHVSEYSRGFVAPERISDPYASLKESMDVYSYGVIVYFIMERCYPENDFKSFEKLLSDVYAKYSSDENTILKLLSEHLKSCCKEQEQCRPQIIEVRNKLLDAFHRENVSTISRQIATIQEKMQLKFPYLRKEECKPLSELYDDLE